jgi:hypothetical protein
LILVDKPKWAEFEWRWGTIYKINKNQVIAFDIISKLVQVPFGNMITEIIWRNIPSSEKTSKGPTGPCFKNDDESIYVIANNATVIIPAATNLNQIAEKFIRLRASNGSYLHRPDLPQGVTTWDSGIGNVWLAVVVDVNLNKIVLRSWKDDYLHCKSDGQVTTYEFGDWIVEFLQNGTIQLRAWNGRYLHRTDNGSVDTSTSGEWIVEILDV